MKNLRVNLLFTLSDGSFTGLPVLMRNSLLPLSLMALILVATTPAAAEQSPQSGAREQVTVSARIISGETVRFGTPAQHDAKALGSKRLNAPMARTRGETIVAGQQRIALTEFH